MQNRMIGLLVVIALVAILPPTIWSDYSQDRWAKWVYDYQPLIAGAFAIFAAYLTVNTMRVTDDRQELRHQELMSLNLRRDKLIARRAAHPQIIDAQDCMYDIDDLIEQLSGMEYCDWITLQMKYPSAGSLTLVVNELKDLLEREQFDEVKPLLDQSGYRSLQIARKELGLLAETDHQVRREVANFIASNRAPYTTKSGQRSKHEIINKLMIINRHLNQLNESIVNLVKEYD